MIRIWKDFDIHLYKYEQIYFLIQIKQQLILMRIHFIHIDIVLKINIINIIFVRNRVIQRVIREVYQVPIEKIN